MIVVFGAVNALVFLPALLGLLGQMRNALMLLVANTTWMCSEPCMLESSRDAAARSSGLLQSSLYLEKLEMQNGSIVTLRLNPQPLQSNYVRSCTT